MIKIRMKNGDVYFYFMAEYTAYRYNRKFFVVIFGEKWIGLFNLDCIEAITIGD